MCGRDILPPLYVPDLSFVHTLPGAGRLFKSTHIQGDSGQVLCIQQLTGLHHSEGLNYCLNLRLSGLTFSMHANKLCCQKAAIVELCCCQSNVGRENKDIIRTMLIF